MGIALPFTKTDMRKTSLRKKEGGFINIDLRLYINYQLDALIIIYS